MMEVRFINNNQDFSSKSTGINFMLKKIHRTLLTDQNSFFFYIHNHYTHPHTSTLTNDVVEGTKL